jgi:hypothetical protein
VANVGGLAGILDLLQKEGPEGLLAIAICYGFLWGEPTTNDIADEFR